LRETGAQIRGDGEVLSRRRKAWSSMIPQRFQWKTS
jgi:hypothetical protein